MNHILTFVVQKNGFSYFNGNVIFGNFNIRKWTAFTNIYQTNVFFHRLSNANASLKDVSDRATYIFFCLVVYNSQFFSFVKLFRSFFPHTQSNSPNARKGRKKLLEWLHFKTKDNSDSLQIVLFTLLCLLSSLLYSQTCVQRLPLGPKKKWPLLTGGRCSGVI